MNKATKIMVSGVIVVLLMTGAFIAGKCTDFGLYSMLGFPQKTHTIEQIPDTEPHTAKDVVNVETIKDFDREGNGAVAVEQQKVPYVVEVDFTPVLLEESQLEKKLIIMTQKASASVIAKKPGLWSIPAFKQTQAIIFHGEGTFYVDLSSMSRDNFVIDNKKRSICIHIPKPLLSVTLLPDETEFFEPSNGVLRFGEMEITGETMTTLQTEGIARITEALDADTAIWETARRYAKLSVKEIYEPLVAAQIEAAVQRADDEYAIPAYYTISVEIGE